MCSKKYINTSSTLVPFSFCLLLCGVFNQMCEFSANLYYKWRGGRMPLVFWRVHKPGRLKGRAQGVWTASQVRTPSCCRQSGLGHTQTGRRAVESSITFQWQTSFFKLSRDQCGPTSSCSLFLPCSASSSVGELAFSYSSQGGEWDSAPSNQKHTTCCTHWLLQE